MSEENKAPEGLTQVGRLAMRVEGDWWVAYYAKPGTMDGAVMLGQVQMEIVQAKDRRDRFMSIMRDAVGQIIFEATGVRPVWPETPQPAPENERADRG